MFSHGEVARFNIRKEKDKDYENHIDLLMEQNRNLSAQVLESNRRLSSLDSDIKEMIDKALLEGHVPIDFEAPSPDDKLTDSSGKDGSRQLGGVLRSGDWCLYGQIYNSYRSNTSAKMKMSKLSREGGWWKGCANCPRGVKAGKFDTSARNNRNWFWINFHERCI